jgi:hypothetical protein
MITQNKMNEINFSIVFKNIWLYGSIKTGFSTIYRRVNSSWVDSSQSGFIAEWIHRRVDSSQSRFMAEWIHRKVNSSQDQFVTWSIHRGDMVSENLIET